MNYKLGEERQMEKDNALAGKEPEEYRESNPK